MEMPLLHVGGRHMQVEEMYLPDVIALLQASHVPQDVLADLLQYQKRVDRAVSRAAFAISAQDIRALCSLMMACVKPATCILVFLPGLKEIEDCFEELTNRRTRSPVNLRVHALHSIVDGDDQARVLIPADASECKIVLSTNIAETSMTIPDVKVVIDLGFARRVVYDEAKRLQCIQCVWCSRAAAKQRAGRAGRVWCTTMVYDEAKRLQCIQCVWCSRAAAKQRAGRAGRVSNGLVLRLYTQSTMRDIMPDFEESDCFPLEASVLKVRQHLGQYGDVEGLMQQLVEPPTTTMVAEALARLVEWGALGPAPSYDILELGEVATMLPIDVSLTKSVLLASRFGCAADMLVIAAGLTLQRSPYRLPMRAFFQSDYEFQENVMLALRSIHHFDQQRCNDLFQYIAILEEALAAGGRLGDFCTRWYLSFRQVQSLLRTTKLLCKRLLTAEQAGKMRFTDADRATMRRLSGEHHHASSSSSSLRFQSLTDEGCSELLQLALAQDAERMVSASVESLTNSLQRLLDNAKAPDGRPPAWLISPESFHSDVVFFSGVDKTVAGAGSKALADHLKLFDVKDSLVFPVGVGTYGAVVRVPHEKETETADRSVSAAGGQPHPQPHPLSVAARTDAICRMGRLYRSSHWSFCTSKEGDMSSSMSLPKAQTTATVKRWKAVELPSKSMNTAESSDDDDDDDYERDDEDDSTAAYSSGSDSSASLPAKTSNRAKKGAAKGKQQKKKKQLTAVVANLQLDRWSAVGSTSTVLLGAGVKSIPAFGFAFNLMSTQASMLLASTVLMINANGGFPLLALLASRRSTQLPLVLQVSVLKPDPFSDNDAPLVKHIATNIPSYDLILESAAAAQSNNATICATTFLELNLIRMLLCTGVAAASPHGDNKQPSRSNKHLGMPQQQVSQLLPTAEAILRTISDIRSLRSSNAANNGARQFVISSGAPPSKSKWETMQLRVARLEAHPQLALYDIATLVEAQRSGVCSATTTSNAAAAPRTAWQRAIHAYTTCVANTAVSITALAVQHQKKQSVHMKRQASNEVPQSVAAPPHADVIALLASNGGDVGAQTNDKRTPLHMAAANGHTLALVELLRLNASIDVADANGTTPLHIAAVNGRVDAVKALLDHHASVGAVMKDGATAIHLAAQGGHADVIAVLAIHGGDVDAQGYDNVAPLHCAAANLHSDALVWSDAVRKWKQQSKETAAPPAVPPASPTLLEPHALPLSRCEGNCLMEFSRHSTSETAVEQLGMLLENTELLDTVLGSFTDVIKCTDDRNLKIIAFLDCLRSRIFLRRTGARDFMDFTNFDPSRMLTMKSAFSHLCDMQLHALQSICLPDSRRPSEAAQALDITDQLPKCFECDDGARNRIILNLWEVVQRKKRTVEPLRSAVEGVDPSILTKLCSTIAGGSTTRTRFARLNLESLGIDSDKWNAFAASNPFNRRNFVREIRSICHEQLKDDANRTLFATNALRFLGGQAVATLLDEIQFAHESGSGLTCMFHPSCQWKVASVDVTWDAFVAHVKEEHCGEGPLGLAFALDNRAYDLDCDAFLRTDPMDTFIFQRKLTQHFFCPVCFRVSDSGDCQPFENYDAMTDHVLRCHNCHGHGSAREVLRCQRAQAIYGFQFQKEPGFRYVQLCSPADRLDARLLFYSNKDRKSLTRCLVCQLHCRNFEATQSHMLHVHPELFDRNETHSVKSSILHCPVDAFECGERFDTPGSLLEHINTSHPHMCGVYGPTIRLSSRWSPSTSFKEILERTAVFIPALVRTLAPTVELSKRSPDEKSVPCRVRILVRSGSETEKQPFVNGPCCLWRTHPPHSPTFISDK
ncbi:helicase, putative, partial [Bodo saltans]